MSPRAGDPSASTGLRTGAPISRRTVGIGAVSRRLAELRRHERLTSGELRLAQAEALAALRRFAMVRSPFYRELHEGLEDRPLANLPIVTRSAVIANWDRLVTDPELRLDDVRTFAREMQEPRFLLDRYVVLRSSGTTGQPGHFPHDRGEWQTMLAAYLRTSGWTGLSSAAFTTRRVAFVEATRPTHQSGVVATSLRDAWMEDLRLDVTAHLPILVAELNAFQPETLVAFATRAHRLADEQIAGRLSITPAAVYCGSEALTAEAREAIGAAFGVVPINTYATSETGPIASDCSRHRLHLHEDLIIAEVVDEDGRAVPPGVTGRRVLITALFGRTMPLIRFELTDRVRLSPEGCDCGLPFAVLDAIEGRSQDVLELRAQGGGTVEVHPNVFHYGLNGSGVDAWQVVGLGADRVEVRFVSADGSATPDSVAADVREALRAAGAAAEVIPRRVDALETSGTGKTQLILARPGADGA